MPTNWVIRALIQTRDGSQFEVYWPGDPKGDRPKVWTSSPPKAERYTDEADAKAKALQLMLNTGDNVLDVWVEEAPPPVDKKK